MRCRWRHCVFEEDTRLVGSKHFPSPAITHQCSHHGCARLRNRTTHNILFQYHRALDGDVKGIGLIGRQVQDQQRGDV